MHNYDAEADEPEHTHEFLEGKCECGESDPNYKPECEHSYADGKCTKCGELHRNKAAHEAKVQPDNLKLLISLTAGR